MTAPPKILIIEDDPLIASAVSLGLRNDGFQTVTARDGRTGLELFQQAALVLLDLMLPDLPGEEVCKRIRAESRTPILVITAKDKVESKIDLLKLGADDYLVKPFDLGELAARIQALLRRSGGAEIKVLTFLDVEMHLDTREVYYRGKPVELSIKEFDLLRLFLTNQRQVLSKEIILNHIWGYDFLGDSNIVEVYIGHLRKKLGEDFPIQTVRGVGYVLKTKPV